MPSRRSHTKSHHGCLQCKQRRVKCDESVPQCQRCARRQMACSFMEQPTVPTDAGNTNDSAERLSATLLSPANYQHQNGSNAPTPGSLSDHIVSPLSSGPPGQQLAFSHLDLELIHYYSTQTYMTMTSKLTAHLVWRDVIFQQGLKHDFLLHALMATAALHKATNHAEDSEIHAAYIKAAFSYQNAALAGYIPALDNPTEDNAVALFILSALLTIWLFGSKKLPEAISGVKMTNSFNYLPQVVKSSFENESTDFLEILTLVQGINAVVKRTYQWLRGSSIETLLKPPDESELPPNPPDIEASYHKLLRRMEGMRAADWDLSESAATERREIYLERLDALRRVSRARTMLEHDQQVFTWPVTCEPSYINLIHQRDTMAVALFVHWAACFKCLDYQWWAKGWAHRLVRDASALLDETWSDVLAWPRKEVGLE